MSAAFTALALLAALVMSVAHRLRLPHLAGVAFVAAVLASLVALELSR